MFRSQLNRRIEVAAARLIARARSRPPSPWMRTYPDRVARMIDRASDHCLETTVRPGGAWHRNRLYARLRTELRRQAGWQRGGRQVR